MPLTHDEGHEKYLAEVRKIPPLDPAREEELRAKAHEGDRDALREVVWSYLGRAHDLALELKPEWMDPLVASQEANQILQQVIEAPDVDDVMPALEERLRVGFEKLEKAKPE